MDAGRSAKQGWVSQPNQRGTLDIIWSCVSTLAICCWIMVHLNIPENLDSTLTLFLRKARWLILALLAPELVMLFACGQWASAQRSVVEMQASGYHDWTMVHAFYADMGGFLLESQDSQAFPITAKQVHYLIVQGFLKMPKITKEEIWDKSKADLFAKSVACFQVAWLVTQVVSRGIQRLPITLLELSTVALVTCTGATLYFWFFKPLNVGTPTGISLETCVAEVLAHAGKEIEATWKDTPLDFIEPDIYTSSQLPFGKYLGVTERPLPRLPNDRDSRLHNLRSILIVAVPTASFSLLHLIAWNFEFPTRTEQLMWRWTCVSMSIVLGVGCLVEAISIVAEGYTTSGLTTLNGYKLRWPTNILFFIPGAMYMSARLIVIGEIVASLRLLQSGCFEVVQWSEVFPHL